MNKNQDYVLKYEKFIPIVYIIYFWCSDSKHSFTIDPFKLALRLSRSVSMNENTERITEKESKKISC